MHFPFKTCQIVADTSMTTQFHEFFECNFWRVFAICPECAPPPPPTAASTTTAPTSALALTLGTGGPDWISRPFGPMEVKAGWAAAALA